MMYFENTLLWTGHGAEWATGDLTGLLRRSLMGGRRRLYRCAGFRVALTSTGSGEEPLKSLSEVLWKR